MSDLHLCIIGARLSEQTNGEIMATLGRVGLRVEQIEVCQPDELDELRKENAKLRYALAMLLPLKQDGSVSICQMQRQFHLGYFAASTIAEAVNASTARHAKGGQP